MLFALPVILINFTIILAPALLTFAAACFEWDGVGLPAWAGLTNFRRMFDDPVFWSALGNNLVWPLIFLSVPVIMALVMAAALLVAPKVRLVVQCIIFLLRIHSTEKKTGRRRFAVGPASCASEHAGRGLCSRRLDP